MTTENQNTQSKPATQALSAPAGSDPVYPQPVNSSDPSWAGAQVGGITLRQHYAGVALQGLLSNPDHLYGPDDAAKEALTYADSMIYILNQNVEDRQPASE